MKLRLLYYDGNWFGGPTQRFLPWAEKTDKETEWKIKIHCPKPERDDVREYLRRKLS